MTIYKIENFISDDEKHQNYIIETITPVIDNNNKPILISQPAGFKAKTTILMKINGDDKTKRPLPLEFPVEATSIIDAFNNCDKFRDADLDEKRKYAIREQMSGGPKIEFII